MHISKGLTDRQDSEEGGTNCFEGVVVLTERRKGRHPPLWKQSTPELVHQSKGGGNRHPNNGSS